MSTETSQSPLLTQLPATQDSDGVEFSQDMLDEGWGVLCSVKRSYRTLVMAEDEYTVGRKHSCDVIFETEKKANVAGNSNPANKVIIPVSEAAIITLSKVHFTIKRTPCIVYLTDTSFNGTYINGQVVGNGKKIILQNNDEISLCHPSNKYFVYMDKNPAATPDALSNYPSEVKDNYVVSRSLGSGSYGEVKLVFQKRSFEKYAMKVVQKNNLPSNENVQNCSTNEVQILKSLNHPYVIRIHNVMDSSQHLYIFLEYMEGGDLFKRISSLGRLCEISTKWIFHQLIRGVEYLHNQGIAHRDLKPENILLSSDESFPTVKISDFGLSKFFNSVSVLKTLCGTKTYVAPEILETCGKGMYSNQVDVWSLGVILYVCLSGRLPFDARREDLKIEEQIMAGSYSFNYQVWKSVSENAKGLISRMMTVNPKMRATITMVKSHPWLRDPELMKKFNTLVKYNRNTRDENEPPLKKREVVH